MSTVFLILLLIALLLLARYTIRTYRNYCQYSRYKLILTREYKPIIHPFSLLGIPKTLTNYVQDTKTHGDSHYTLQHVYPSFDVGLGNVSLVFLELISPQLIKQFFIQSDKGYYEKYDKPSLVAGLKSVMQKGLALSEGEDWKYKRKLMSQVFSHEFIKSKLTSIIDISDRLIDEMEKLNSKKMEEKDVIKTDIYLLLQQIFGTVVIKCFFGEMELGKIDGQEVFSYVNSLFLAISKRAFSKVTIVFGQSMQWLQLRQIDREINRKKNNFRAYARRLIEDKVKAIQSGEDKKGGNFQGVIQLLVSSNKLRQNGSQNSGEQKDFYTTDDLINEFCTFFFAGTDTTSNVTTVLIYCLAKYPEIDKKLREEIHSIIGTDIRKLTAENLKKMTYLDCVQKQALRMYAPFPGIFPRIAVKPHMLDKIPIQKGVMIMMRVPPNHFRQQFYSDPFLFRPERWQDPDLLKGKPYAYYPFSSGQRNCIGQQLSLFESKIVIAMLLTRFEKLVPDKLDFKMEYRVIYTAEDMLTTLERHKNMKTND